MCPTCGGTLDIQRTRYLLEVSRDASEYGVHYRDFHERFGTKTKALLGISELWTFVAVAIVSGILGNAAYDAVRAAVRKILSNAEEFFDPKDVASVATTVLDEREFSRLVSQVQSFLDGLPGIDPEVREALVEEMIVDEITHQVERELESHRIGDQLLAGKKRDDGWFDRLAREQMVVLRPIVEKRLEARGKDSRFDNLWSRL